MFSNIGGKIKTLAMVICWIGIICSVICGMILVDGYFAGIGIIVIIVGSLLSWVSSFVLYGFGQLIQNTDKLVSYNERSTANKKGKATNNMNGSKEVAQTKNEPYKASQKVQPPKQNLKEFLEEIMSTDTAILKLILQDQTDLYSQDELDLIEKELLSRENHGQ